MLSAFFLVNANGNALITRMIRDDLRPEIIDQFRVYVIQNPAIHTPMLTLGGITFLWIRHMDLCIVAGITSNTNPTLVFEFLFRFVSVCNASIGELNEEAVKKHFMLIYEMLDEMMDFGYPLNTDIQRLETYIVSENIHGLVPVRHNVRRVTTEYPTDVAWRQRDVKYRKNRCFVDVIEKLNLTVSSQGMIVKADVEGVIKLRPFLSGMPHCLLSLNCAVGPSEGHTALFVKVDECMYHPCVGFTTSNGDSCLSFVPPDDEFELMRYTAKRNVRLPVRIHAVIKKKNENVWQYQLNLRTCTEQQLHVTDVVIRIPTPHNAVHASCDVQLGKVKWDANEQVILWRIPRVQGMTEWMLRANVHMTSEAITPRERLPLQVDFTVPSLTASGIAVRYLQITERSNYRAMKWVRYETHSRQSYLVYI